MFIYCVYAVTYGIVGLWSVAVLNILIGVGVCCMAVGHHGRSL
jgi:hypothetical protein